MSRIAGEKFFKIGSMGWTVRYRADSDHWMEFKAYEVIFSATDGSARQYGLKGELTRHTSNLDEAEPDIVGFVKWDGCMEFDGKLGGHFCGAGDIAAYGEMLRELHALCKLLPSVDLDCAGYEQA